MDEQNFSEYLSSMQTLFVQGKSDKKALRDLAQLISHYLHESRESALYRTFFLGEMAFFEGNYEEAKRHYKGAEHIPNHLFFLYRAQCFLCRQRGEVIQAREWAQKALQICPTDSITKHLLDDLSSAIDEKEKQDELPLEEPVTSQLSLTDEEFAHLEQLFEGEGELLNEEIEGSGESFKTLPSDDWNEKNEENKREKDPLLVRDEVTSQNPESIFFDVPAENDPSLSSIDLEYTLEEKIAHFQEERATLLSRQADCFQNRILRENVFLGLQGWDSSGQMQENREESLSFVYPLLPTYFKRMSGGFYVRWQERGIVINPGMSFLHRFYEKNFSVTDIDYVIVTQDALEAGNDLKAIFDLNEQQNNMRKGQSLPHIIHYYLHKQVYQNATGFLYPNFREEKDMLHSLEFYRNSSSSGWETISLNKEIDLVYLKISGLDPLAIKLILQEGSLTRSIGFLSSLPWSSSFSALFQECDCIVAGFGSTREVDFNKQHYQKECLGYFGCSSLLFSTHPKVFIFSELDGTQGDIRLEIVKKMRQEYLMEQPQGETALFMNDFDFQCNLTKMKVYCSICQTMASPERVRMVRSHKCFGKIHYLCPNCYL